MEEKVLMLQEDIIMIEVELKDIQRRLERIKEYIKQEESAKVSYNVCMHGEEDG